MTGDQFRKQRPTLYRAIVESTGGDTREIEAAIQVVQYARAGIAEIPDERGGRMSKQVLFSIGQITRRVSDQIGQDVDKQWCSRHLKEIDPVDGRGYQPSKRFTGEQSGLLILYAMEWYHKHGAPSFAEWIKEHGHPVPQPFLPPEVVAKKKVKSKDSKAVSQRELERIVNRAVEKALKERQISGQIESSTRPANREEDIKPLNRAVNRFVFDHPIDVRSCWKWLQQLWEERNGAKVMRVGDQSFPQWLHSSGNMPQMMEQLQGYLDFMHDEISNKQGRLSL